MQVPLPGDADQAVAPGAPRQQLVDRGDRPGRRLSPGVQGLRERGQVGPEVAHRLVGRAVVDLEEPLRDRPAGEGGGVRQ
jgi:hypothetical protein